MKRITAVIAVVLFIAAIACASTPSSGTLTPLGGSVTWTGFPGPGVSPAENTCIDGANCDVFLLTLSAGDYTGKRLRFKLGWNISLNDYDIYLHGNDGTEVPYTSGGAPSTTEEGTYEINRTLASAMVFRVHVVYFAVGPLDPYRGTLSIEPIPVAQPRTARYVKGAKTHIEFSRNRRLYAFGARSDGEPNARVDFQGNAYVGAIRGLTGGNDLWRFDLNRSSLTYDPFLRAATPTWYDDGRIDNPAWKGQPDGLSPSERVGAGGDGGGDQDLAVAHAADAGTLPKLAATSLLAANISAQRSDDRGDSFLRNPVGNGTVPEDDRNWMEFYGKNVVYLAYRELAGLQSTSKYYVNRSEDGGLTYGPAILAALGGNTTGNIDIDQNDGTVYFCFQGPGSQNNEVRVAVGRPRSPLVPPTEADYQTVVAARGQTTNIAALFPVVKVARDGTVYVAYSDGGTAIFIAHSRDHGTTWSDPVRVSDLGAPSSSVMPWIAPGELPGSLAIAWFGVEAADSDDHSGANNDSANWKVFFAQSFDATAHDPTFRQAVASDHYIHGSNISLGGLGGAANRNLVDFFQLALDPDGFALIAFTDDSADFAGHTVVTHQIDGDSLNTGKRAVLGKDPGDPAPDSARPQVRDFRHDARLANLLSPDPDTDTPADIYNIRYDCERTNGKTLLSATMRLTGLSTVPPAGIWQMNFSTNPTRPGLVDRADQWFIRASTDDQGAQAFSYGTAVRTSGGGITYTVRGAADSGSFDTASSSVMVKVDLSKLNAIQSRGAIASGTELIGLRGSAQVESYSQSAQGVTVNVGLTDATRAGANWKLPSSCFQ